MKSFTIGRRLTSEFIGTALLLAVVIGSGIMGETLAGGNTAIALLANTLATGAALVVLITVFGPVSGAHFNPAVTLTFLLRKEFDKKDIAPYILAQISGGILGVFVAHVMFAEPVLQVSAKLRGGAALGFSEFIATFGLIVTILGSVRFKPDSVPLAVGLYITSAYWFTASTSFANPAVTIARMFSDTFAGIAPSSAPLFIICQLAGAFVGACVLGWMLKEKNK
ncbi:MAG: MIP/aquaporin family protein [Alphaproteobacteria bacterium]|nr:MIP/aquaporin family protein [Alphaproteobacteria bacterium]